MNRVNRQALVKHQASKMFALVNDVKQYPLFLKWCEHSYIIEHTETKMIAGMTVSLAGVKQKFTTQNILINQHDKYQIKLSLINGPFENLSGHWLFTPLNDEASKIELHLDFSFKSGFLNSAFKRAFGKIAQQLVSDFVNRANHVYS